MQQPQLEEVRENQVSWLNVGLTAGRFSVWTVLFLQLHVNSVLTWKALLNYFFTLLIKPLVGKDCNETQNISVLSSVLRVSCWLRRRIVAEGWPLAVTLPPSSGGKCKDRERRWKNKQAPFEDVKRQRLSCAATEARTCADNSSADQRHLYSVCCGLWCRRVDFNVILKHILQIY